MKLALYVHLYVTIQSSQSIPVVIDPCDCVLCACDKNVT